MSAIGSLGSATASNITTGPSCNATGKVDLKMCGTMSGSDADVLNRLTDVGRHDLCVSAPQQSIQAYASVFSFDPFVKMTVDLQPIVDFFPLPTLQPVIGIASTLDMNISRYYRDVGDARNDLEYILAMKKISLHVYDLARDKMMRELQDRLTVSAEGAFPEQHFHRRNALFLSSNVTDFANDHVCVTRNKGSWVPIPNTHLKRFIAEDSQNTSNSSIYGLELDVSDAGDFAQQLHHLRLLIEDAIEFIDKNNKARVHTNKNRKSGPIDPPELVYAGVALTDASAHPQNGDNALTLNVFSAVTLVNGPFHVQVNDDLMWIHDIELPDFEKDGMRRMRLVLDFESILGIMRQNPQYVRIHNSRHRGYQNRIGHIPITNAMKHVPGKPSRNTFIIAPQLRGFGILKRHSLKDKARHIGKAISSCLPSKRLDLINGAVAKL